MRALPALAVALALVLAGCGGDDDSTDTGPDSSLIPPASTEAGPTSTDAPAATDTTAPPDSAPSTPTAFTAEAADAVNELEAAWEAGDQARARAIAPGDVVDALFLVPPDGFEVYGCDTGQFETSTCNFRNRSTGAFIVVSAQRTDQGWQIATIDINED